MEKSAVHIDVEGTTAKREGTNLVESWGDIVPE